MSYIIKNSTQGAIVARLTDAGRKKLSEGKLNIGLFQLGDSEVCYDCYSQLPAAYPELNVLQAEHNAQNLNPYPAKNKGHIKYPLNGGINSTDTSGPTVPQHTIQEIYNRIKSNNFKKNNIKTNTNLENIKIDNFYIDALLKDIKITKKLKVAIDAGNGAAGPIALEAYKKTGLDIIDLYCNVDGNFPNHHPNPSDPKNLQDLISCVKKNKCDIGIAFDGDGDRCLVIDNLGEVLWPDKQMMIYAKDILSINKSEKIVYDVKSSKDLANIIKEYGGEPVMCRTGHSYIKMRMKEINAILGGEMSGHIFFKDRWFGFDDGIYAGIRMLEIISNSNKTSSEIFDELPKSYSTPELNIPVNKDGFQHEFMEKFSSKANFKDAEISKIDGVRADFANGWGILRASNTTPCLVMRFEAKSEEILKNIKDTFINEIFKIDPGLEIPDEAK